MRSFASLVILLLSATPALAACPESAPPQPMLLRFDCGPLLKACPNGPVRMQVYWGGGGGTGGGGIGGNSLTEPPPPIQPCDTITWSFGDGTTETVTGSGWVTHDYPAPGNYDAEATVTNALGSATARGSHAIATSFTGIEFVASPPWIDNAPYPPWACANCVVAHENDGTVTLTVERSLDVSRGSTADAVVESSLLPGLAQTLTVPVRFLPGERRKSFTIPIVDDDGYYGPRSFNLALTHLTGGTQVVQPWQVLTILDDDPRPAMALRTNEVTVVEGDGDGTPYTVAVGLSAAVQRSVAASFVQRSGTATAAIDFDGTGGQVTFPTGATAAEFTGSIAGDRTPEPDETFFIRLYASKQAGDPIVDETEIAVTILNDDAALAGPLSMVAGTAGTLELNVGSPFAAPAIATFTSSNEAAVPAPAPVTIPAGATRVQVPIFARARGVALIGASVPARTTEAATVSITEPKPAKRRAAGH